MAGARSAFNARAQDGGIILIESISFDAPKTKQVAALLKTTGAGGNILC